jgi:hypothetical protein
MNAPAKMQLVVSACLTMTRYVLLPDLADKIWNQRAWDWKKNKAKFKNWI